MTVKDKRYEYLWIAKHQARYENFIHTVADTEEVWMIGNENGELLCEKDSQPCICVWPEEYFAERYLSENLTEVNCAVFLVDLDLFMDQLCMLPEDTCFLVFPTGDNDTMTDAGTLSCDLQEELEQY